MLSSGSAALAAAFSSLSLCTSRPSAAAARTKAGAGGGSSSSGNPYRLLCQHPFLVGGRPVTVRTTIRGGRTVVFQVKAKKREPLFPVEEEGLAGEEFPFDPPPRPEGYVPPPFFDEIEEPEEEVGAAFERIYGPAYSGETFLGGDINVMDVHAKRHVGKFGITQIRRLKPKDGMEERVVQVRRVTKVIRGGRQLRYRAVVVVGDLEGTVGVGVGKAREITDATEKALINARRTLVTIPMTKYSTFPHRLRTWKSHMTPRHLQFLVILLLYKTLLLLGRGAEGKYGAAKVMLRPAAPGSGVIAGGAVRAVLEVAGVQNALGKQIGSNNALNNARATLVAVKKMWQFREVAEVRGIPMEELWK